jgi:hypothetical protein
MEKTAVEFQTPLDNGDQLIIANHGCACLCPESLSEFGVLYYPAQSLGHLSRLLWFYQQAIDTVTDKVLTAAHPCGHTRQATCHSFQ